MVNLDDWKINKAYASGCLIFKKEKKRPWKVEGSLQFKNFNSYYQPLDIQVATSFITFDFKPQEDLGKFLFDNINTSIYWKCDEKLILTKNIEAKTLWSIQEGSGVFNANSLTGSLSLDGHITQKCGEVSTQLSMRWDKENLLNRIFFTQIAFKFSYNKQ